MPLTRGQRLRRLREQRGVEIKEAAPAMGISRGYLSLLERDLKGRNLDHVRATFAKAAAYYGVIPEYLLAETPQEHMAAFVQQLGEESPRTFGERLALVLKELQLRWGEEEFSEAQIAAALGTAPQALVDCIANRIEATGTLAGQLSAVTGAPVEWLVPRQTTAPDPRAPFQRAIQMAVDSGMQPDDLEAMIQIWLAAKGTTRPSGG